ncbi:hypothetical protein SEA_FRANSOYER_17 [Microbacterium phage Fransoyer]|nr:hypothetical protein SEA_RUBYRALPH_17 [Microbacterium phage RubyRalph]QUE25565.1 hypothetical protein SEA_SADLAD_18 [Microbacterium phage SadLad]UUG69582.1 hypothetical protein SEA_FRANSOYER_17 [Microbacterium phage Fransoyer]
MSAAAERSHHAICGRSYWRPLYDASEHPMYFIMLGAKEVAELIATGTFTIDEREVPESVREWRKLEEGAAELLAETAHA